MPQIVYLANDIIIQVQGVDVCIWFQVVDVVKSIVMELECVIELWGLVAMLVPIADL